MSIQITRNFTSNRWEHAPLTLATETTMPVSDMPPLELIKMPSSSKASEGAESREVNVRDDILWLNIPSNAIENADSIRVH
jgi:hypothetical protein